MAFDFETANSNRNSACALGVAVTNDGAVTEVKEWRFRPRTSRFDVNNVRLHGITQASIADCHDLPDIWDEIRPYFENRVVIAHYATFDISVLQRSLDSYSIRHPDIEYSCSWLIAKATWPGFRSFSLPDLASRLGLATRHHDALSDAKTCAALVLAACKKWDVFSLDQVEANTKVRRGRLSDQGHTPALRLDTTISGHLGEGQNDI